MKAEELRSLSPEELLEKERSLKEELFKLNMQRYSARVDKPHKFSLVKRDLARIQTILNEKKVKATLRGPEQVTNEMRNESKDAPKINNDPKVNDDRKLNKETERQT